MFISVRTRKSLGEVRQRFEEAAAKKVLDTNVRIGTALPCRVTIYTDGGEVVLETLKPTAMLAMFGEPSLDGTARDIETAIEAMKSAAAR